MVSGPWIAIAAVADGREAALSIDRHLKGMDLKKDYQLKALIVLELLMV